MGGSSWSSSVYVDRTATRAKTGAPVMAHMANIRAGRAVADTHADLKPNTVAGPTSPLAGTPVRESRDSDVHPISLPICVFFDVTGSMGQMPEKLETKLGGLMALLVGKGYVQHPQVLFGAIGDAYYDRAPLQVGQFESGIEMDDVLTKIYVERGGGGGGNESYELAHYYVARHTATDAWDKRQVKGYLFTMGDEMPYANVSASQVLESIGDALQADIPTKDIVAEVASRYHTFHIHVQQGSYRDHPSHLATWRGLLPEQHVLLLENWENAAELIATTVAINEGTLDLAGVSAALKDAGLDESAAASISSALVPFAAKTGALSTTSGSLSAIGSGSQVDRL